MPADNGGRRPLLARFSRRFENDASFRIWILKWFWLTSLVMMLMGYAIMVLIFLGHSPFK